MLMAIYVNAHRKEGTREVSPEDFMPRRIKGQAGREHGRIVGEFANFQAKNYNVTVK